MKLLFKRDEVGDGQPSPDQVSVGELVMNSVTGRLYTKLIDNFAKINDFIFPKFREIQNIFVKISCFAKFLKWCFAATLL